MKRVWLKIAAALVVAALVLASYAYLASMLDPHVYPGIGLVGLVWVVALTIGIVYGVVSYQLTGDFGWKQFLKLLAHLTFAWLRHWRLVVALIFISAGLIAIGASPRTYLYQQVTGYRYILEKEYVNVVDFVSGDFDSTKVLTENENWSGVIDSKWITYLTALKVTTTSVLRDVHLVEIPVYSWVQVWYLDMGLVLIGITLIVIGLIFGLYQAVLANNKLLQECGEHTAKFHVNMLKMMGWEIPDGFEDALAKFYKTGDSEDLRRYY